MRETDICKEKERSFSYNMSTYFEIAYIQIFWSDRSFEKIGSGSISVDVEIETYEKK